MKRIDHQTSDGEWHIGWKDGMCAYEDDGNVLIVDRRVHRHPFGTEYTEVLEVEHNYMP
jgi:CobQ-like glutamine amidotransferase family enzyme